MVLFFILAIIALIIFFISNMSKTEKIEILENNLNYIRKCNAEDILKILYQIREEQNKAKCTSTHDGEIRKIVNYYIEVYSHEAKKLELNLSHIEKE